MKQSKKTFGNKLYAEEKYHENTILSVTEKLKWTIITATKQNQMRITFNPYGSPGDKYL